MSSITQKYTVYLPNASAYYFTADSSLTSDSTLTSDSILSVFTKFSATLTDPMTQITVDDMDITVDDNTITVDFTGFLHRPLNFFTIYLPTYIGTSFTADSALLADSLITADTTII